MSQLRSVSFNPRDQHILAGGSIYGAVGIWDVRKSQGPVECVPIDVGHTESVTSLIWSNSKAGGEFFSAAGDGKVNQSSNYIILRLISYRIMLSIRCFGGTCGNLTRRYTHSFSIPAQFLEWNALFLLPVSNTTRQCLISF